MAKQKSIWNLTVAGKLLKASFNRLQSNDPLRMAGATAFFTSFALPPIMVLLFQFFSIFFNKKLVGTELHGVLSATLGKANTDQLRIIARGFRHLAQTWYMAVIGLLFLIFVATTLFKVIRNTLNDIWHIRPEQAGFLYDLKVRGKSLVIILTAAVLFIAGGIITIIREVAGKFAESVGGAFFTSFLNGLIGVLTIIVWFIVLFRFLANGRPSWRVATAGGILTGMLFYFGKTVLSAIMRHSNADIVYGAGAAIVLILLFMFYSSFILYFGACFIKEFSLFINDPIVPTQKAHEYEIKVVDEGNNETPA